MPILRRLVLRWPFFMAGAFLAFTSVLLWNLHTSQTQLRLATDASLVADGLRHATVIADFVSERRQSILDLADGHEIEFYLASRALGMSPRYGLNAALSLIEQRFRQKIDQNTLRGEPIYQRIVFRDPQGTVLAQAGNLRSSPRPPDDYSLTLITEPQDDRWELILSAPVHHKGAFSGTVETATDLRLIYLLLDPTASADPPRTQHDRRYLLTEPGIVVPRRDQRQPLQLDTPPTMAALAKNTLIRAASVFETVGPDDRLLLRTPIPSAPASIVTLTSEAAAYRHLAAPGYAWYLALFPAALLLAAGGFERMRRRVLKLQQEFTASTQHRSELEHRNQELSQEISRRRAAEADLQEKTEALDQLNADLRIAAVAFDSQEGMAVTDAHGDILRVNRAFMEMTGYAAEEIVGQPLRPLKSDAADGDYFRDMWDTVHRTGRWHGEVWDRNKRGDLYTRWLTISAVKDVHGAATHYILTYYDISERKRAEQKINELAFFDQLTGLPNRALLIDRIKAAMAACIRSGGNFALLFIDLDNFKTLNDTRGHDMGDLLLEKIARRLTRCVRREDTVARFGGDEFIVLLTNLGEDEQDAAAQAEMVAEKILATLKQPHLLGTHEHLNSASIGIALFGDRQQSIDELLKRADMAMYEAKAAGRNTLRFFDPAMQTVITRRAALEADFREAVRTSQFFLHYQGQVDEAGTITGAEVLLRWRHPQRGMVSPAEFIPLAENTGLIRQLGCWVLETACAQLAVWARSPETAHLTIAVNVSALQLHHKEFVEQVLGMLDLTGADPRRLKLELTESLLVNNVEDTIAKMARLKARGVSFSLDDFGTGYSSLSYLKRLPLDQLKIDQSFVRDILTDPNDASIARMIVVLGGSLGLDVIAEGVETEAQRDFLARIGCRRYQGYLFGRPVPLEAFERSVADTNGGCATLAGGRITPLAATG